MLFSSVLKSLIWMMDDVVDIVEAFVGVTTLLGCFFGTPGFFEHVKFETPEGL